jgi:nucleoside-diphosphate-sugar epimerase
MTGYTVLGASGFIGRHLVRHLRAQGEAVRTPARDDPQVQTIDLGKVIYCIGLTGDFIDHPLATVEAHVCAFAFLLRHARFSSLVYLSSTRVYDGQTGPAAENRVLALDPQDPRHIYDFSKGTGEALCHAHPDRHCVVARLSSVYSDALDADNFLHEICRKALSHDAFEIETSLDAERDYIHIDDVCAMLVRLANAPRHRAYNVASGVNLKNRELIDLVRRETGRRITVRESGAARPVPTVDISRAKEEFGFAPAPPQDRVAALLRARLAEKP